MVAGVAFGLLELFLVSVGEVVGVFVAVAFADHLLGDVRAVRQKDVTEEPTVLVPVGMGGVALEPDFLSANELGHPLRRLATKALNGFPGVDNLRGVEADEADARLLAVYQDINGVAVHDFGDGVVGGVGGGGLARGA